MVARTHSGPPSSGNIAPHVICLAKTPRGKHEWTPLVGDHSLQYTVILVWATSLLQSSSMPFFWKPKFQHAWNMLGEATLFAEAIYCRANGPNSLFNGTQQFVRLACPLTAPCHENGTFFRATKVERGQFLQKKLRYPAIFWVSLMILGLEPKLQMLFQLFVSKGHAGHHLPT